jgi:hypothetical protein
MAEHPPGDKDHPTEPPLLHAREHEGSGDGEGARGQPLGETHGDPQQSNG